MMMSQTRETPSANRKAAAALAALGAASAIPIPLAQLDFAGLTLTRGRCLHQLRERRDVKP